ncbi:alpha/beta hydrolase [Cerasicoccus maritimus]|uniref:alpha/beta hydrolase n=1 Tax=Cerasicoccus maritimus TaxID=490089 RepID=UPI002852CC4A|nr:alpha/beta hydrolase [Cerasicoccus maritimus]
MRNTQIYLFLTLFIAQTVFAQAVELIEFKEVEGENLTLHVAYPAGHSPSDQRPAVVFFFGGGWKQGKPGQFYPYIRALAKQGIVGISAQYRTKSSHGVAPDVCVKDGKSAIRYVRMHAGELGIDPNKVLAGGGSAGGHVAACTAIEDAPEEAHEIHSISSKPAALILLNPVLSTGPNGYAHSYVKSAVPEWKTVSPLHRVDELPPTLVEIGDQDNVSPLPMALEFQSAMEQAGQRCDLVLFEGAKHGFFNRPEYQQQTFEHMNDFLRSLGYLD